MFLNKLPKPSGDKIKELWKSKPVDIPDTLGGIIRTIDKSKRYITKMFKTLDNISKCVGYEE